MVFYSPVYSQIKDLAVLQIKDAYLAKITDTLLPRG